MRVSLLSFLFIVSINMAYSKDHETIHLWPEQVPGETESKAEPVFSDNRQGNTTRIAKVTDPGLIVYEANPEVRNGAAVIICPGGGYYILAIDKEGYEVAEWLSGLGYTAFVLQYRVPDNETGALQDAQRAVRYVRGNAEQWGVERQRIGVLGFSAGGSLGARVATRYNEDTYPPVDKLDRLSSRPDFAVLVYPAYLDRGPEHTLTPELKVDAKTPPMFFYVAGDDEHANSSLVMGTALSASGVPFELHVVSEGGHGFGLRPGNYAAETWPGLCAEWMKRTVFE